MPKIKRSSKRRWIKATWTCGSCDYKNVPSAYPNPKDDQMNWFVSNGWKNCVICGSLPTKHQRQDLLDQVTMVAFKENMMFNK